MVFLTICIGALLLFLLSLIVSTCIMDTRLFMTYQFLLSSLKYSKEVDTKINFILAKHEADLLIATIRNNCIEFHEKETSKFYASIWIGNKYYTYGYLWKHADGYCNTKRRPAVSTFKKIVHLEDTLSGKITKKPSEKKKEKEEEVILN